jgi:hypothetical protein
MKSRTQPVTVLSELRQDTALRDLRRSFLMGYFIMLNTVEAEPEGSTPLIPKSANGHDHEPVPSFRQECNNKSIYDVRQSANLHTNPLRSQNTRTFWTSDFLWLLKRRPYRLSGRWDSSVSTVTRLQAGRSGFGPRQGQGIFLIVTVSRLDLGPTDPPIKWVTVSLSPRIKRPGREADHSPPSISYVQNVWGCKSTPSIRFFMYGYKVSYIRYAF